MMTLIPPASGQSTEGSSSQSERCSGDPYREICDELYTLLSRKRGYYGCGKDPLENALAVEDLGVKAETYQEARIAEKTRRLRGGISAIDRERTHFDIMGHAALVVAIQRRKRLT
jgi:hypothetical protein